MEIALDNSHDIILLQAELHLPDVMIHFDVIISGNSNSMVSLTTMVEAKATSWSSDVSYPDALHILHYLYCFCNNYCETVSYL